MEKQKSTILIVDDDVATCETLSDIFELNSFAVKRASNGREALEHIKKHQFDVIFLDIRLPDIDGLDLMTQLMSEDPDLIFVFMTGYASVEYAKKAYEKGASGFFIKPVLIEEALHVITEAIEKRNLSREYARAEQERNKALVEYEDLYNNAPDMFASIDVNLGIFTQCNQTLLEVLGYSKDELLGSGHLMIYNSDDCRLLEEKIWPTLIEVGFTKNKEVKLLKKNGKTIPVTLNGTIATDEQGEITQARMVWHDLTESKKLEEQLLISEKMTTIAGLAAGVAHEINTPLSGILQSIQLVEMGFDPKVEANQRSASEYGIDLEKLSDYIKAKELDFFLTGIRDSAIVAARIVSDLLQFSRPKESEWIYADVGVVIERAIALAKSDYTLKKKYNIHNVKFINQFDKDLTDVKCMAMELEQVLINLIKNSCQAMVDGTLSRNNPVITHKTYIEEDFAIIEVIDNGPGISSDIIHHIFDPFFTTKEVGDGTGLGLSVSYSIINVKHGGDILVQSNPDDETKFIIKLPLNKN